MRPERMNSTSIICLRRDIDHALEALNDFGEFHIEQIAEQETQAEYSLRIQDVEKTLNDLNDLVRNLNIEKRGLLVLFRQESPQKTKVTARNWKALAEKLQEKTSKLKQQANELTSSLATLGEESVHLKEVESTLKILVTIGADLSGMQENKIIRITFASVPQRNIRNLRQVLRDCPMVFYSCYLAREKAFVCMATTAKYEGEVEKALKTYHGEVFQLPEDLPQDAHLAIEKVYEQIAKNTEEEGKVKTQLADFRRSNLRKLLSFRETSQNILAMLSAGAKIRHSERLATIKGFVPKGRLTDLRRKMDATLNGSVLVLEESVEPAADPPTKISNNRFVKPFEEIIRLYGVPHYEELDPTPFIAFTFPLIFGLMFGDVGHGLVLLVGGVSIGLLVKNNSSVKNMCWILAACGVGAVFAGLLFGEFFGTQIFPPLWFSPFDNVFMVLIFSIFVGVLQLMFGLVLDLMNYALRRNFLDIVLTSVPKIAFYAGSIYLLATYQLNFEAWMHGPILLALGPFLILVLGKPIVSNATRLFLNNATASGESASFSERLIESGNLVTRLLSNTVSYSRILALLMAHWALVSVIYIIAGLIGSASALSIVLGGFIVVLGNMFVIALEGLIVFIHTLRLHFYEWFSKFYAGTGTEFSPFKQSSVYTEILLGEKEQ